MLFGQYCQETYLETQSKMTVCYYHVTYEFQRESTFYSLARSRRHIWSLSDSNQIHTHNHLVRKQTLNHFALGNKI